MAGPEEPWATDIRRDDRVKVCQHIMGKLASYFGTTTQADLKARTRKFENQIYTHAKSKDQYLQQIAHGLSNIEKTVGQTHASLMAMASLPENARAPRPPGAQAPDAVRLQMQQVRQNQFLAAAHQQQQMQMQQALLQQRANSIKQQHESTRKSQPASKRNQYTATDQKTKDAAVAAKSAVTAAQNASLAAARAKNPTNGHPGAGADQESFRRKAQMNGKQLPFNPGQSPANGAGVSNEHLFALARQHESQVPNATQGQSHGHGQAAPQAQMSAQTQPQFPPGSLVPGVLTAQQQMLRHQQAGHPPSAAASAHRTSQALLQHSLNRTGAVAPGGMMVDHPPTQADVERRRARAEAAVAAAAATAGYKCTPEEIRGLSLEQVQQILNAANQRNASLNAGAMQASMPMNPHIRMSDGQATTNPHVSAGVASAMTNNWIGSFGSAAAQEGNGQVNMGIAQNQLLARTLAMEQRKKLQEACQQQQLQHGNGAQVAVGAASGKSEPTNSNTTPAGVTVPQMNTLVGQNAKMEKSGNPLQDKKAITEAIQNANRARAPQALRTASAGHILGANVATAGVASSIAPAGQMDEEFWAKLEDMQRKYRHSLQKLFPIIRQLQERHTQEKRDLFMSHLKDAFNILYLQRSSPIPQRVTLSVLERAERFIHQVVSVHSRYLKDMVDNMGSDPVKKQQVLATIGGIPMGAQPGSGIPSQGMSHVHNPRMPQQAKTESSMPQGIPSQDARQQYARRYSQLQQHQQEAQQRIRIQQQQYPQSVQKAAQQPPQQRPGPGPLSAAAAAELAKTINKTPSTRSTGSRGNIKNSRGSQGTSSSRTSSGMMSGPQQMLARPHEQAQANSVMQQSQANAVTQAQAQAQAEAQAQAQTQALLQAQEGTRRAQQLRLEQVAGAQQRVDHNIAARQQKSVRNGQHVPGWRPEMAGGGAVGRNVSGVIPGVNRSKRPELTIQQRLLVVDAAVKEAVELSQKLESIIDLEMRRDKNERIQTTLAALRNNSSVAPGEGDKEKGTKRQITLVDVENYGSKDGVIKSKTVFECSSDAGLRLAKRPKNEAADLRSLREAVEADCIAAKERNPLLMIEIIEEFGLPVVTCLLRIPEIRLPKLVLRVQRGYPRKGGATYGFERPPMGWVGVLDEIRTRFKRTLATAPAASVGVAAFLDAWATEADNVINGSCLSESR